MKNFEQLGNLNKREVFILQAKGLAKDLTKAIAILALLGLLVGFIYNNASRLWFVITKPEQVDIAIQLDLKGEALKMEYIQSATRSGYIK